LKTFCEVLNRKIMPSIKSYIAVKLVREYGFTQLEVARILGMKQSAVNYAITGRRTPKFYSKVLGVEALASLLDEAASKLARDKGHVFNQCELCHAIIKKGIYREILSAIGEPEEAVAIPTSLLGDV